MIKLLVTYFLNIPMPCALHDIPSKNVVSNIILYMGVLSKKSLSLITLCGNFDHSIFCSQRSLTVFSLSILVSILQPRIRKVFILKHDFPWWTTISIRKVRVITFREWFHDRYHRVIQFYWIIYEKQLYKKYCLIIIYLFDYFNRATKVWFRRSYVKQWAN